VSLVNDALLAAGKPVLGFLNPWLYAGGFKAFTDITSGSSTGCGTTGFPAQTGWDAATGFGTPVSVIPYSHRLELSESMQLTMRNSTYPNSKLQHWTTVFSGKGHSPHFLILELSIMNTIVSS